MKKIYCFVLFFVSISVFSQCFDCAKNIGGHTDESAIDIEKTTDGIVYLVDSHGFVSTRIIKYDFNCNLIWSKEFGYSNLSVRSVTSDNLGNIYLIIVSDGTSTPPNGFTMFPGLNFYKLSPSGLIQWHKHIDYVGYDMVNIFYVQNQLIITGTYHAEITFENNISFVYPYTEQGRGFIAKYNMDGTFVNAVSLGDGNESFEYSDVDTQGNIYLTSNRYTFSPYESRLQKYDFTLQVVWSSILSSATDGSTESIYIPTGIRFNKENNKIYLWGKINMNTSIMGNAFFVSGSNGLSQSVLTEFNSTTGNLEQFKRFDNNSFYTLSSSSAVNFGRSAYMAEKNNELYVLTSFSGSMSFPNGNVVSETYYNNTYNSESLVLFKVKLSDFSTELLFQSYGDPNFDYFVADAPGDITFNGDDLYLTSTFSSKPMHINGSVINNNSGNNAVDAMLYKFNINSINSGEIKVENTCLNELTNFDLNGSFDTINWNFGDPSSSNNTSNATNPQHQFSSVGSYHITAVVTCAGGSQTIEKDIEITDIPTIGSITPVYKCETVSGSGISSEFDTSAIHSTLINGQQNVSVKYENSTGTILPSPLPNPYTNNTIGGDIITAKVYFSNNPYCYAETNIELLTTPKPSAPLVNSTPLFCMQENKTLADITITGQNLKWYDALTNGTLLPNATLLVNGTTYYVSQTINGCESERVAVVATVYETAAPTGMAVQTFCDTQVLTLADFVVSGTDLLFYDGSVGGNLLPISTTLVDGVPYYASQTLNVCESVSRLALTPDIISGVPANDFSELMCDDLDDGIETVDLSDYIGNLIANASAYTFNYYTNFTAAENEGISITGFSNYTLNTGLNTIYVRVEFANSCYKVVALELTVVALPKLNMKDSYSVCENGFITITADAGFDSYSWSTGATSQAIVVTNGGNYWVTVTKNTNGLVCSSTKNITVEVSQKATITAVETVDWTSNDNVITVYVDGSGVYEYSVDGINFQSSNQFFGLPNGEYTVYVNDTKGCGVAKKDVYLLMYPKYFTPNGDSYNDFWGIQFYQNEMNLVVKIFDRYGKFIKQLNAKDPIWDGTYEGNNLPATDYWFTVIREDGTEYNGHFTLKR